MDAILKPLISLSLLGIFAYAVGIVLTEGHFSRSSLVVPRRRRDRYVVRSISFLEFVLGLVLTAAAGLLYAETRTMAAAVLFWVTFALIFVKFLVFTIKVERIQEFHAKNRLNSKVGSVLVMVWLGLALVLLRAATTEAEKSLSYVVIVYVFFVVAFLKANLTKTYINVVIVITLKEGETMPVHNLLDETQEFFVLASDDESNLLIPKSVVASAKVWLEERPLAAVSLATK